MGPEPLPKTVLLPRVGRGGAVEQAAVAYQLVELPFTFERPDFVWSRLRALLTKAEVQLYASWANDVWAKRVSLAWDVLRDAGFAPDLGGDSLLELADFLLSWYPRVPVREGYEQGLWEALNVRLGLLLEQYEGALIDNDELAQFVAVLTKLSVGLTAKTRANLGEVVALATLPDQLVVLRVGRPTRLRSLQPSRTDRPFEELSYRDGNSARWDRHCQLPARTA